MLILCNTQTLTKTEKTPLSITLTLNYVSSKLFLFHHNFNKLALVLNLSSNQDILL